MRYFPFLAGLCTSAWTLIRLLFVGRHAPGPYASDGQRRFAQVFPHPASSLPPGRPTYRLMGRQSTVAGWQYNCHPNARQNFVPRQVESHHQKQEKSHAVVTREIELVAGCRHGVVARTAGGGHVLRGSGGSRRRRTRIPARRPRLEDHRPGAGRQGTEARRHRAHRLRRLPGSGQTSPSPASRAGRSPSPPLRGRGWSSRAPKSCAALGPGWPT